MATSKSNPQIVLRPQDLVVLLRLSLEKGSAPTYAQLAEELSLTASEIHAGLGRAVLAQLARKDQAGKVSVVRDALKLFVQHGARYAYPVIHGSTTRGLPTGYAAPPPIGKIIQPNEPRRYGRTKTAPCAALPFIPCIPRCRKRQKGTPRFMSCSHCSMRSGAVVLASERWQSNCSMKG